MVVLKGSVPMSFGGSEQPAAYGELVSIGGLNPDVNKKLSAAVSDILETKLSVPKSRFFLKFYDTKVSHSNFLIGHGDGWVNACGHFSLHLLFLFRPIRVKNMHSVYMLYTRTRDHVTKSFLFETNVHSAAGFFFFFFCKHLDHS